MKEQKLSLARMQRKLWLLGKFRIPLIGYCRPRLIQLDEETAVLKIHLRRRTRNHLGSMYFGALAVGADLASGIHAFYLSELKGYRISFVFKDVKGEFLKRAESDVRFISKDGAKVAAMMEEAKKSGERQHLPVSVEALNSAGEQVALFSLTLSVKVKG
jgi:acyl-coenzyme A thioesterase PaaI-like protein